MLGIIIDLVLMFFIIRRTRHVFQLFKRSFWISSYNIAIKVILYLCFAYLFYVISYLFLYHVPTFPLLQYAFKTWYLLEIFHALATYIYFPFFFGYIDGKVRRITYKLGNTVFELGTLIYTILAIAVICILELIWLSFGITYNYVEATDMIFNDQIKTAYFLMACGLGAYTILSGSGGIWIMIANHQDISAKEKKINYTMIVAPSIMALIFISSTYFLHEIIEQNDGFNRFNTESYIDDIITVMGQYNELENSIISKSSDSQKKNLNQIFSEYSNQHIDDYDNFDTFRSDITRYLINEDHDSLLTYIKGFYNGQSKEEKEIIHWSINEIFIKYLPIGGNNNNLNKIIKYLYYSLKDEMVVYPLEKVMRLEYMRFYMLCSIIVKDEIVTNTLYKDYNQMTEELIIIDSYWGIVALSNLITNLNWLEKFHKTEKVLLKNYYSIEDYESKFVYNDNYDDNEVAIIRDAFNTIQRALIESISKQRTKSDVALKLFRELIAEDENNLKRLDMDWDSYNYMTDLRRNYEIGISFLSERLYKYPEDGEKVNNDVLQVIERNKSRYFNQKLNVDWLTDPPELDDNECGINYIVSNTSGHTLGQYYDKDTTISFSVPFSQNLQTHWENLFSEIDNYQNDITLVNKLKNLLFPAFIQGRLANRDVFISPDSYLQNIPYQLILEDVNISSITIIPNFTALGNSRPRTNKKLLSVSVASPTISHEYLDVKYAELDYAEYESEEIAKLGKNNLNVAKYYKDASETLIKNHIAEFDIIHFSAHSGEVDKNSQSGILLNSDNQNDGILYTDEISRIKLDGQVIFLSSCESAVNDDYQLGEGIMSIAKAFIDAGASNVIASLWELNDEDSPNLVLTFYKNYFDGQSISKSMYNAQKSHISMAPKLKYPFIHITY